MILRHLISKYKYALAGLFFCSLSISVIVYTLINSTENPISIQNKWSNYFYELTPQGWSYFTRNPREAQVLLYSINQDEILEPVHLRHSSYKNAFGINRRSTKLLSEIQGVKERLNDSLFTKAEWNYQSKEFLANANFKNTNIVTLNSIINDPIMCGNYLLVFQNAVPWAWSKNYKEILMPSQIIRITIKCSKS